MIYVDPSGHVAIAAPFIIAELGEIVVAIVSIALVVSNESDEKFEGTTMDYTDGASDAIRTDNDLYSIDYDPLTESFDYNCLEVGIGTDIPINQRS